MKSRIHIIRAISGRLQGLTARFFCKLSSAFSCRQKRASDADRPLVLLWIRPEMLGEHVPEDLTDHAVRWLLSGYRLQVIARQEGIPSGCIGVRTVCYAGKQVCRDFLMLQSEGCGKSRLLFQKSTLPSSPTCEVVVRNNSCSCDLLIDPAKII